MAAATNAAKLANTFHRLKTVILNDMSDVYMPRLRQRRAEVNDMIKEKSARALNSELARKLRVAKGYYRLEMAPPRLSEIKTLTEDIALVKAFIQNGCYNQITVRQAWLLFLVGTEVGLWFFLGETIGKMHIVGYKV